MSDKTCFVISPIGSSGTDVRNRADKLFDYMIDPTVEEYGYEAKRSDHIDEPGIITSQIIEEIVESELVVADLTGSNANVFYELALRHAIQKPCIQLIDANESIPFDVSATRVIQFDIDDIESVEDAKDEIRNQIESLDDDDTRVDTPISVAMDLKRLKESTDPDERSLAEIIDEMGGIRKEIQSLKKEVHEGIEMNDSKLSDEVIKNLIQRLDMALEVCDSLDTGFDNKDDAQTQEMVREISHHLRVLESTLYEHLEDRQMKSLDNFSS